MSISKKKRFEIFKRDKFTCQYCGQKAPDVILECIHPQSKQGSDKTLNLITSCFDCNRGKSNVLLSNNTVLEKQHEQMSQLQERRDQIDMLFEWQQELMNLDDHIVEKLSKFWSELLNNEYSLTDSGKSCLKKIIKRFDIEEILSAMSISVKQYIQYQDNKLTEDSVRKSFNKIEPICKNRRNPDPNKKDFYYIRKILLNRNCYVTDSVFFDLMEQCIEVGINLDNIKEFTKQVKNWSQWRLWIEDEITCQKLENIRQSVSYL